MRKIKAVFFALCTLLFNACAKEVIYKTVYKDVYIPVPCTFQPPEKPKYNGNPTLGVYDLIDYIKKYHIAAQTCQGNSDVSKD